MTGIVSPRSIFIHTKILCDLIRDNSKKSNQNSEHKASCFHIITDASAKIKTGVFPSLYRKEEDTDFQKHLSHLIIYKYLHIATAELVTFFVAFHTKVNFMPDNRSARIRSYRFTILRNIQFRPQRDYAWIYRYSSITCF